jgi:hypothetical protein
MDAFATFSAAADLLHRAQKEPPPAYVQDDQKVEPHDPLYPSINLLLGAAPPPLAHQQQPG